MFSEPEGFSFGRFTSDPIFILDAKATRTSPTHTHTYADPFLFTFGNELFLFYEIQRSGQLGRIAAFKTKDLVNFVDLGEILSEPFHLSYPFVFEYEGQVYMIPESSSAAEVLLYRFGEFPLRLEKMRTLLNGAFFDSSLHIYDGVFYLFTTSATGLEIFTTNDLLNGDFIPIKSGAVTSDIRYRRCGGGLVSVNGYVYRIAQSGENGYGSSINVMKVTDLSQTSYREELFVADYTAFDASWNTKGGHHMCLTEFLGKVIIAVDGKQEDLFINKLLALVFR